jgi:hypothetical protein
MLALSSSAKKCLKCLRIALGLIWYLQRMERAEQFARRELEREESTAAAALHETPAHGLVPGSPPRMNLAQTWAPGLHCLSPDQREGRSRERENVPPPAPDRPPPEPHPAVVPATLPAPGARPTLQPLIRPQLGLPDEARAL